MIWALENWQEFDAWCCVKNIDPLELSSYRLYNLVLYHLQEGKDEEGLNDLESRFRRFDNIKHPLHDLLVKMTKPNKKKIKVVEEPPETKHAFIPSWWRGDAQNYVVAKSVMKTLPKN